ncbi:unannotated protein [freshwater metagenome]|uniref:Unannotated protein n=1 Tax=freshwater metagenome TaxID=449393 RepID=A0A6J6G2H7_9ZZZZ
MSPVSEPKRSLSQPALSPDGTKQMSCESGLLATNNPRSLASFRVSVLTVSPNGKMAPSI